MRFIAASTTAIMPQMSPALLDSGCPSSGGLGGLVAGTAGAGVYAGGGDVLYFIVSVFVGAYVSLWDVCC